MTLIADIRRSRNIEAEKTGTRRGFYLVKGDARHWVSEKVNVGALERVCDRVLSEKAGFDYWIDYSYGVDVDGAVAWSNIDQTERFL